MATEKTPGRFTKTHVTNLWRYDPEGTYYLFARIGGKLKKKSLETKSLSVARIRLAERLRSERKQLELRGHAVSAKLTLKQASEELLLQVGQGGGKSRTAQFYRERVRAIFSCSPELQERDCGRLSVGDCNEWANRYRARVKPATFNGTLLVFRKIMDLAVDRGVRYDNPLKALARQKLAPKRPVLPSQQQFQELLASVDSVPYGHVPKCAKLVRFLAFSGTRISEARRVQWSHVDFDGRRITVHGDPVTNTKNWEIRDIPMIPEMEVMLRAERQKRADEPRDALVMQVKECNGALATACRAIGIAKLTHHDLRDLFATRCIEQEVDIPTVAKWLGHKDGGALLMKVYSHLRAEHSLAMGARVSFGTQATREDTAG